MTALMTPGRLLQIAPRVQHPEAWALALQETMERHEIHTPRRAAAFVAQLVHESAGFTRLEESLNYSAWRLLQVWPTRFAKRDALGQIIRGGDGKPVPDPELAARYERRPEALANFVYANRMGNGPEASGQGWLYRGRGPIQLTGLDNYTRAGRALDLPLVSNPDLLLRPREGCLAAGWFWTVNRLNALADRSALSHITEKINGGQHGAAEREALYLASMRVMENVA